MNDRFFFLQTGKRQFRVFERSGVWWGVQHTYSSRGRAAFCTERLNSGKEQPKDLGSPPKKKRVRLED